MTLIKSIEFEDINIDWLTPIAREEFLRNDTIVADDLYLLELDEPVMVVGMRHGSLLRCPEIWILLCAAYRPLYLRWSKRMIEELLDQHTKLHVWVRTEYLAGLRFAAAHGFVTESRMMIEGVEYEHMIARRKWA